MLSMKKITTGSGYDYLIRQVAAQDTTVGTGLAAYYEQKGEAPGEWINSGLASLDGINGGDPVTEAQMQALFGAGLHPLAEERRQAAIDAGVGPRQVEQATRLGKPFANRSGSPAFQQELRRRYSAANAEAGRRSSAKLDPDVRAQIRSEVAREFFTWEFSRPPVSPRELQDAVVRWSRPAVATIAGFDLTFSPVKSVSSLWALADVETAKIMERAHRDAVAKSLKFLESEALFTRAGAQGVRQIDVRGLVGAAFTHRDSRAGDPDLHTHVAIANKVQALDGRWLAIDASVLHQAKVAASETYNTALEAHLVEALGVRASAPSAKSPESTPP